MSIEDVARLLYERMWHPRTWEDVPPAEWDGYRDAAKAVVLALADDAETIISEASWGSITRETPALDAAIGRWMRLIAEARGGDDANRG